MKKLKIYKNDEGEFVLQRINEYTHSTKRFFISEEGLLEGLDAYSHTDLSEYDIEILDAGLWAKVINHLNR